MKLFLKSVLAALLIMCIVCMAYAEDGSLSVVTDRRTDVSQGPGTGFPKSGVFAHETFAYSGVCIVDASGEMWHKAARGEWEMWINAADATVMYNGVEMPEEFMLKTTATVNLRSGPGYGHESLTVLEAGEQLVCIGEYQPFAGGSVWYMVSWENGAAWVNSRYAEPVGIVNGDE